ncbi:beta-lactamase family protein [Aspergillus pseudoustus]|uniref:Beta-lactamase family protein n=1 Tax=Aspergillus pseudoustus TaxID=1810923 RepID=A0ABR4KMG1_9EURO
MAFDLTHETTAALRDLLEESTSNIHNIPGAVICVVNKDGRLIFSGAAGKAGVDTDQEMTLSGVFWFASCSKLITSIACMQLVEKGLLRLDDADQLENLLPPLRDVKVLERADEGRLYLVDKKSRITLRMLLTHTAGFGYSAYSPDLRDWMIQEKSHTLDFAQPLIAQPGENWNYGFNIEWVSLAVEKVSGLRMSQYFQQHIFDPLDLKSMTLFPDIATQRKHLLKIAHRCPDGTLKDGLHFMQSTLDTLTPEAQDEAFQNGAGGCFGTASDYCAIIAVLLNDGTSPTTNARILQPSTVKEMFENHIPSFPNFARKGIPAAQPQHTFPIPELYPSQPHDKPQGWGLSFMLTLHPTSQGRGPFTGSWAGMCNSYWWADRSHGVGGFIGTQIVPFFDLKAVQLAEETERLVYSGQSLRTGFRLSAFGL